MRKTWNYQIFVDFLNYVKQIISNSVDKSCTKQKLTATLEQCRLLFSL